MADNYHLIDSPLQTVVGSRIAEMFEIKPASTYINNLAIVTGGGYDTIKINDSNTLGFDLTITDWNSSAKLDFSGTNYGTSSNPLLFWNQSDGRLLKDANDNITIKFLGYNDTISFTNSPTTYLLTKTSSIEGGGIAGTQYDDEITINHPRNSSDASRGNDTITVNTDNNAVSGNVGDDIIIFHGNNNHSTLNIYNGYSGNDTLISDGNNNYLYDTQGNNVFVSGGDEATIRGGDGVDTFAVYSYGSSANVTITGGGNNDSYILSTGLVGIRGTDVGVAGYNSATNDTLNVAITDLDSLDTIYIRNKGMTFLRHDVAAEGIKITDNTGRINIFLPDQRDWNVVKDTQVTFEDMNGNNGTLTLEQAENLPIVYPPAGVNVDGYNATVTSAFSGNLFMVNGWEFTNFNNQNIVNIDATQNSNPIFIAANIQSNVIFGGPGQEILWGGTGGNDTLISGGGQTTFWYGQNDGYDVIINAHDYDTINLYDVSLGDITAFNIVEGSFAIGFRSGNALTVADNGAITPTMQLSDGSRYAYNRTTATWF